jgi:hypothetical protein
MQPTQFTCSTPASFDQLPKWSQFFEVHSYGFEEALDFFMNDADVIDILKKILEIQGKKIKLGFGSQRQPASYYPAKNTIVLNKSFQERTLQDKASLLFFELQNACQCRDFRNLRNRARKLGKEKYVREVEKLEYNSSLATNRFVNKYIEEGIFTKAVPYFYVALNFQDYYLLEQLTGHAQIVASQMDTFMRTQKKAYRGTWPAPLTDTQSSILHMLLCCKIAIDSPQGVSREEKKLFKKNITTCMQEIDSLYLSDPKSMKALWKNAHKIISQTPPLATLTTSSMPSSQILMQNKPKDLNCRAVIRNSH